MDYMKELNAFRNWQLLNPLTTGEVALWHTLMSLNNMAGWKAWFVVPNSTVQLLTGLSKQGMDKARMKLIQRGLIEYRKGGNGVSGQYKMNSVLTLVNFQVQKVDQVVDQVVYQNGDNQLTETGTASCPLIDIDKDIDIHKTNIKQRQQDTTRNVFTVFEREGFGTLSSFLVDEINDLVDTYTEPWVIQAMYESVRHGKRTLKYVHAILRNWKARGMDEPWKGDELAKPRRSAQRGRGEFDSLSL